MKMNTPNCLYTIEIPDNRIIHKINYYHALLSYTCYLRNKIVYMTLVELVS